VCSIDHTVLCDFLQGCRSAPTLSRVLPFLRAALFELVIAALFELVIAASATLSASTTNLRPRLRWASGPAA